MAYNKKLKLFEIDCKLDMINEFKDNALYSGLGLIPLDCPCGKNLCHVRGVYPRTGNKFNCEKYVKILCDDVNLGGPVTLHTVIILCRGLNSFNFIMED